MQKSAGFPRAVFLQKKTEASNPFVPCLFCKFRLFLMHKTVACGKKIAMHVLTDGALFFTIG